MNILGGRFVSGIAAMAVVESVTAERWASGCPVPGRCRGREHHALLYYRLLLALPGEALLV